MMYVKRLYMEDFRILDPDSLEIEVVNPTWEKIESGIRRLDGVHRSTVIIGQLDPETDFMGIGGGKDGLYRCFIYDRQGREYALIDPSKASDQLMDMLMGQTTSVSAQECVKLDMILMAAKTYSETGELDTRVTWKEC